MKGNAFGRHWIAIVACVILAALIAGVSYLSFFYQPILVLGTEGFGPIQSSGQGMNSYNNAVTIRNPGWSSVTISAVGRASSGYRASAWRVSKVKLCTVRYHGSVMCDGTESTGSPESGIVPFKAFTVPTNKTYSLLWRMTYKCRQVSYDEQMSVPLRIHYLWIFTRNVTLTATTFAPNCVN